MSPKISLRSIGANLTCQGGLHLQVPVCLCGGCHMEFYLLFPIEVPSLSHGAELERSEKLSLKTSLSSAPESGRAAHEDIQT